MATIYERMTQLSHVCFDAFGSNPGGFSFDFASLAPVVPAPNFRITWTLIEGQVTTSQGGVQIFNQYRFTLYHKLVPGDTNLKTLLDNRDKFLLILAGNDYEIQALPAWETIESEPIGIPIDAIG